MAETKPFTIHDIQKKKEREREGHKYMAKLTEGMRAYNIKISRRKM